ncbi:MAG: MJ1255/VC2487 family glycosyltransferase [Candidatus Woesearchaeota archaeon]
MARILYGICGEGMGHAMRSKPILEYLQKHHEIKIYSSGKAHDYLSKIFKIEQIDGVFIEYKDNAVDELGTLWRNVKNIRSIISSIKKVMHEIDRFKPDLIITDFEAISCYAGLIKGIPIINIDNQHIYTKTNLKFPLKLYWNYLETIFVNRLLIPTANKYIITSFFDSKPISKKTIIVPPILRNEIIGLKPKEKDFILVYQTSNTDKKLLKELKMVPENFIIYGFNKDEKNENLTFRKFNEDLFFKELKDCKAMILNGGFTAISEALYLKKPILSIPVRRQFEQTINAIYLNRSGYGKYAKTAERSDLLEFVCNLNKYNEKLKNYKKEDNSKLFSILNKNIEKYSS